MNAVVAQLPDVSARVQHVGTLDALFVLNNLSVGGSEVKIVGLANELHRRGMSVGVCYLNEPHRLRDQLHPDVPIWCLERRGKYSIAATKALRRLIVEHRARTVLAVNSYPTLYVAAATRSLPSRPRTIVLMNTNGYPAGEEWRRYLYRSVMRLVDETVYGSEVQRDVWIGEKHPLRTTSAVIHNGVDTERFSIAAVADAGSRFREGLGLSPSTFLIGGVGRLVHEKNHIVLIDALRELRLRGIDAHVVIAGVGPCRELLEERAIAAGLQSHVTLTGVMDDVRGLLASVDVFVLPSLTDTFSNAALEAMSMSRPVILSRTGGATEMVQDGREGFIIAPSTDADELVRVLCSLHAQPELRARMGQASRDRILRDFSWPAMVSAYEKLLTPSSVAAHG
ncbi:MAG: glycosyltransferase family 4 protein [Povalibacter sp.]